MFVTVDKDLPSQQNVAALDIAVIVLRARRRLHGLIVDALQYRDAYVASHSAERERQIDAFVRLAP